MSKKMVSFVTPVFNEADNIYYFYNNIRKAEEKFLSKFGCEIIFVNDGSTDNSLEIMKKIAKIDKSVKILSFRKNQGKALALEYGYMKARGEVIISLDADLQDGPENIPTLFNKMNEGFDMVVGWRKVRHDSFSKRFQSRVFNFIIRVFSGLPLHDFNSGLKIFKKEVANEICLYGEMHRFIPILAAERGFKITEVPVIHHERKNGRSKYGWERAGKAFFDLLTITFLDRFSNSPLHLFGILGSVAIFMSLISGSFLLYVYMSGIEEGRIRLLILAAIFFVSGIQFISLGLVAELISSRQKTRDLPVDYETIK